MGYDVMTARLEVRYRKPVPLGSRLLYSASLQRHIRGHLDIKLGANLEDEFVVAKAAGRMMIINH